MTHEQRFTTLQQRIRGLHDRIDEARAAARHTYGQIAYAPRRVTTALEKLETRVSREEARLWALVNAVSPRDWTHSIPAWWIWRSLTWADATTTQRLAQLPPPAYGYTTSDVERFAEPVTEQQRRTA